MNTTFIYALEDPRNNSIRYIGKADKPNARFEKGHLRQINHNSHKSNWIKQLIAQDLKPVQFIIDEVNILEWIFWERHYISLYRSFGFNLLNETDGGEGESGWHHSDKTKNKLKQYKKTVKHRNNISNALTGLTKTKEHVRKMVNSNKMNYKLGKRIAWNKGKKFEYKSRKRKNEIK